MALLSRISRLRDEGGRVPSGARASSFAMASASRVLRMSEFATSEALVVVEGSDARLRRRSTRTTARVIQPSPTSAT